MAALSDLAEIMLVATPALVTMALVFISVRAIGRGWRLRRQIAQLEEIKEQLQDDIWQLRDNAESYRSLVEGQDDLILRRDPHGVITFCNEAFARAAGKPREELIGSNFALEARATGAVHRTPDGCLTTDQAVETAAGLRWISWIETPLPGGRDYEGVLSVGRDVTHRQQIEAELEKAGRRAEAASEAKSRFLATVSHEIRTPLNGVLGMADLLLGTPLDPEQKTYVEAVRTSGQVLLSILDEILDFSKIEAGRLELAFEPFELTGLVEGAIELLAPRAQGKGIEIAGFISADVGRQIMGDAVRLRQVLMNLAGNAVKFTDAGGVAVKVRAQGQATLFEVIDTGVGVPADRLERIFDEFEQVDGSASSRHGGTGLGLSISRRLVRAMGGELQVRSSPGQGSVFSFAIRLPAVDGDNAPFDRRQALGRAALIVARSGLGAECIADYLGQAGMTVTICAELEEAKRRLEQNLAPDLLIVDGAVGEEEARILAAIGRAARVRRRVVLLSPFERRAFGPPSAAGFDQYLVKPVREHTLIARLLGDPVETSAREHGEAPHSAAAPRPGLSVLLAEDNDINALLATKQLQRLGAVVMRAANGLDAVARFEASCRGKTAAFDLILMDIRMPGLDGHQATRRIRAIEAEAGLPRSRIVALTANAFDEDRRHALDAGMDATITKPLSPEALAEALCERTSKRRMAGE